MDTTTNPAIIHRAAEQSGEQVVEALGAVANVRRQICRTIASNQGALSMLLEQHGFSELAQELHGLLRAEARATAAFAAAVTEAAQ